MIQSTNHTRCLVFPDQRKRPNPMQQITRLLCLPQYHSFILPLSVLDPLREGATTYLMRRFSLPKYLDYIQRFQITEIPIVPPILLRILHSPLVTTDTLASLRCIWCAGAPLDKALQRQFVSMLSPKVSMTQLWGMTETAYITSFLYPERDDSGSVGRLLPNVEAKYVLPIRIFLGVLLDSEQAHRRTWRRNQRRRYKRRSPRPQPLTHDHVRRQPIRGTRSVRSRRLVEDGRYRICPWWEVVHCRQGKSTSSHFSLISATATIHNCNTI